MIKNDFDVFCIASIVVLYHRKVFEISLIIFRISLTNEIFNINNFVFC